MQTSFASILFAAAAILPSAMASPTGSTLEARKVALPAANQAYLCNTQKNSAGTSNIREGINKLKTMNTKDCAPGDNGKEVRMIKGDGYSFYIGSTGGVKTGNWKCNTLEDPFVTLVNSCGGEVNGDYRAGGVVWVPGYEGKSYIYATDESY